MACFDVENKGLPLHVSVNRFFGKEGVKGLVVGRHVFQEEPAFIRVKFKKDVVQKEQGQAVRMGVVGLGLG
jgi:hypothetical protein